MFAPLCLFPFISADQGRALLLQPEVILVITYLWCCEKRMRYCVCVRAFSIIKAERCCCNNRYVGDFQCAHTHARMLSNDMIIIHTCTHERARTRTRARTWRCIFAQILNRALTLFPTPVWRRLWSCFVLNNFILTDVMCSRRQKWVTFWCGWELSGRRHARTDSSYLTSFPYVLCKLPPQTYIRTYIHTRMLFFLTHRIFRICFQIWKLSSGTFNRPPLKGVESLPQRETTIGVPLLWSGILLFIRLFDMFDICMCRTLLTQQRNQWIKRSREINSIQQCLCDGCVQNSPQQQASGWPLHMMKITAN